MIKSDHYQPGMVAASGPRKVERRLAAILAVDVSGYSAIMGRDEEGTHRRVGTAIGQVIKEIKRSKGRVFSFAGDGLMAELPSAVEALKCALRIQADAGKKDVNLPQSERIRFRIGISSGEIMVQNDRAGGTAVNIAARLEQLAEPGGVCLSGIVFDQVNNAIPADYIDVGRQRLKNIRELVPAYKISATSCLSRLTTPVLQGRLSPDMVETTLDYRPSLAVLPFRSLQEHQAGAYFAEGMVDDIIRVLGGLKDLIVVSRSSTLGYAGTSPDVHRIGQELNVLYVLHGSVRREGTQLRIAVELDDANTRQSIWADSFDGDVSEIFELQDRIALRTASSIAPYVHERELRRAFQKDKNSITAYDLTLQALDHIYFQDRHALSRGQELLEKAIALDSNYSAALSHLAYLHLFRICQGWSHDEHEDRLAAVEAAQRCVARDRNDALALAIHGHLRGYLLKDHQSALAVLDRAIAANPSCALAWTFSSFTRGIMGDAAEALTCARKAIRLAPIGPDAGCWHEHALSQAYYMAGQYAEAIAWGRTAANHGRHPSNLRCLIASLVAEDQMEEARAVAVGHLEALPDFRLGTYRSYTPLKGQIADLFIERLRRAGLPE